MAKKQKSYQADETTEQLLKELKAGFEVSSESAAIRRALALARVMVRNASPDHTVRILDAANNEKQIILNG